jgi:hypothetical protein
VDKTTTYPSAKVLLLEVIALLLDVLENVSRETRMMREAMVPILDKLLRAERHSVEQRGEWPLGQA